MSTRKNGIGGVASALALALMTSMAIMAGATLVQADTCCFPDGTCQNNLLQGDCIAAGGKFTAGITCEEHPCPPIGACCYSNGTCAITAQAPCVNGGGQWQGQGSTCANSCQAGSCCFANGSCQDLTADQCAAAGGRFRSGITCAEHPCPVQPGACCFADGSCQDLTEDQCVAAGGRFSGDVTCALHPCPVQTGACCFEDGSCQDLTEDQCLAAGGQFSGDVSCALHPCPQPDGEACPRTVGFWGQQCACSQGEGGPVKFSCSEMDLITACIESKSSFFAGAWGDARTGFCATVNVPRPMDQRKQAKRQFAGLLANVCAGELGIIANNGDVVSLPEGTEIDACSGFSADTIGELIDEVNALLISLEGQALTDPVKAQYGQIIGCTDRINNGGGGIPSCESNSIGLDGAAAGKDADDSAVHTTWGSVKGIYR